MKISQSWCIKLYKYSWSHSSFVPLQVSVSLTVAQRWFRNYILSRTQHNWHCPFHSRMILGDSETQKLRSHVIKISLNEMCNARGKTKWCRTKYVSSFWLWWAFLLYSICVFKIQMKGFNPLLPLKRHPSFGWRSFHTCPIWEKTSRFTKTNAVKQCKAFSCTMLDLGALLYKLAHANM